MPLQYNMGGFRPLTAPAGAGLDFWRHGPACFFPQPPALLAAEYAPEGFRQQTAHQP
ncbi:MAG TPA: hypothetical protein VGW33_06485 [Terriglobia bacterium]|nr:hypothetical protein [Terriglobia bacterium]